VPDDSSSGAAPDRLSLTTSGSGDARTGRGRRPTHSGWRHALKTWWPTLRVLLGFALAGVALWVLSSHTTELHGLSSIFDHLRWWWLVPAALVEVASIVAFAGVQYRLLEAGRVQAPAGPLVMMTFGAQAINNSLPAGGALAAVYGFRWFRRFGADDAIAGWALVGTGIAAAVSLALLAAGGIALATSQGANLGLIGVIIGVLVVAVAVGALFVYERPLTRVVAWSLRMSRRLIGRPRGDLSAVIEAAIERIMLVDLGWSDVGAIVGWGLANWLLDCGCFALAFLAVGAGIPWGGLLLAYGAGQLAANLPITPGGLGAVEGSITIALTFFGGAHASTVEAVLVYRLISFWGVIAVGWLCWGALALGIRRGRWPRRVEGLTPLSVSAAMAAHPAGTPRLAQDEGGGA